MSYLTNPYMVSPAGASLTDGLKAYYTFGASSSTQPNTASDVGSTDAIASSDITLYGNTTYDETGHLAGVNAIGFPTWNLHGNYATSSNSASDYDFLVVDGSAVWTICFWAKNLFTTDASDWFGCNGNGSGNDIQFRYGRPLANRFTIWFAGNEVTTFTQTLTDSLYHFFVVQWDEPNGLASFQIDDGTMQTLTGITTANTSSPPAALRFGDVSGNEWQGDITLFYLYNRILESSSIDELWNGGVGKAL